MIGAGYVGLVTAACLAAKGHRVTCVDTDLRKVRLINNGKVPFVEPGLAALVRRHVPRRLRATTDLERAVLSSELSVIAVGTPFRNGRIDLGYIRTASEQIGRALAHRSDYHVVVVKSTVVPGTTDEVVRPLLERTSGKRAGAEFGLCVNPEFLSEGSAVRDCMQPDRLVLGTLDDRSTKALQRLYRPFRGAPMVRTGTRAAEMIKYTSNTLLATLISFSNEIANLGDAIGGIDAEEVMRGVHLSQYLSPRLPGSRRTRAPIAEFLRPGCGFGGSCLPKDLKALIARGDDARSATGLLRQVDRINRQQPRRVVELLRRHYPNLTRLPVAVLGLSFKPDTDDLRESPALAIVKLLIHHGAHVKAYDPVAVPAARRHGLFEGATLVPSLARALAGARAVVLVTAWSQFRSLEKLPRRRRQSLVVVDGRRLLRPDCFARYEAIGRVTSP